MESAQFLKDTLRRIDRKGYKAYKDIKGRYDWGDYVLSINHVQGDPFAAPSRVSVHLSREKAAFPAELFATKVRKTALADFLGRSFNRAVRATVKGSRGTGKSGYVGIDHGRQEVLERTSIHISEKEVEARFFMGLPGSGRTILGGEAQAMFFEELPAVVNRALLYKNLKADAVRAHVETVEDQESLRSRLKAAGLVAFVGDGAVLPRRSGVDDRPLTDEAGVVAPFQSPESLAVEFDTPNAGTVRGMGIPRGITLIVGGGFHGKSTLLHALERGVYCHIPGDGRERVATLSETVKIRAEDGRSVEKVDISPFIANLPYERDTVAFSTENASGSTSQVANIMESLETGAEVLLMDEDTCATNLMIRDERMQELVAKDREPITPYIDKARHLYAEYGVSTILVMGGVGDYFDVADTVIMLDNYYAHNVTGRAMEIKELQPSGRQPEGGGHFGAIKARSPRGESFNPSRGKKAVKIDAKGVKTILFGRLEIDLGGVEQLVDESQTRAIGDMLHHLSLHYFTGDLSLRVALTRLMDDIDKGGLDILSPLKRGDYALPRIFEVAAAVNRMRSLKADQRE